MSDTYSIAGQVGPEPALDDGMLGSVPEMRTPPPRVSTQEEYSAIQPDAEYLDPEGNLRKKPWQATDAKSYASIPEGALYTDPGGNVRRKPKYEGVGVTTQTLYDMAVNDRERRRALERSYPGRVKESPDGFLYVQDDDGTLRKPGSGGILESGGAAIASAAAPTAGSILGAIGGAPGGLAGVVAGGIGGGVLGQAFNDLIMGLTGVINREPIEEGGALLKSGLMGAAGAGVGRGLATVGGATAAAAKQGTQALPTFAAHMLGADAGKLAHAIDIAEQGYKVPPSAWAMESPYLHKAVETLDPTFRTQNVLKQSAEDFMEVEGGKVLDSAGVPQAGRESIVNPTAAVSSEEAGAAILQRARQEMMDQDAALAASAARAKEFAEMRGALTENQFNKSVSELRAAEKASMEAAERAINAGFDNIQADVKTAMNAAKVGANSGELWGAVAGKFQEVRNAIVKNFKKRYDQWDNTYGALIPDTDELSGLADHVIRQMPEGFASRYPSIYKQIGDLADVENPTTLGQLHNLRTSIRSEVNWYDLTPDFRDGAWKMLAGKTNQVIQAAGDDGLFREAAKVLNDIDAGYGKSMSVFKDRTIQSVVDSIEAGVPADPRALANVILKEGRTDLIAKVRDMVGPNYWNAIKAADVQDMLDSSKSIIPGQIDGRVFVRQVLERDRGNMLEAVHGKEAAERLRSQAQYVAALDGKLDIPASSGDTVFSVIEKARKAADAAKAEAAADPVKVLQREMKGIHSEHQRKAAELKRARRDEPLGFLYDPSVGATEAADRILKSEDLIFAAASKFGENSPEFDLLRQVFAHRVLQGTLKPGARMEKITPEIQRMMFPGTTLDEMKTLAKNMEFLSGAVADPGTSIAAAERVLNPWGSIGGLGKIVKPVGWIPGMDSAGRAMLTKYYKFLSDISTSPATLQWVAKGLNGSPSNREAVKEVFKRWESRGGPIGAGMLQGLYQVSPAIGTEPPTREHVMGASGR